MDVLVLGDELGGVGAGDSVLTTVEEGEDVAGVGEGEGASVGAGGASEGVGGASDGVTGVSVVIVIGSGMGFSKGLQHISKGLSHGVAM